PAPTPTELLHARASQLLERYGVLTREAALGEGTEGGFAGVYTVLKAMEEQGSVRRGYFVAGLGAAQFALPGAVDRLRAARSEVGQRAAGGVGSFDGDLDGDAQTQALVLAATDPAQPFGASLPWPESAGRPARAAGAHVVLVDGEAAAYLERGARSVLVFPAGQRHDAWIHALVGMVRRGRLRSVELAKIDGAPARESTLADRLREAGFVDGYRGLVYRTPAATRARVSP
ncbi:MAG: putative ATP-dependent helicase, partial [Acidimicrobiales bacterium]|nr:putative ATP-dependent helicase [Acidimicrobiales bacterium]